MKDSDLRCKPLFFLFQVYPYSQPHYSAPASSHILRPNMSFADRRATEERQKSDRRATEERQKRQSATEINFTKKNGCWDKNAQVLSDNLRKTDRTIRAIILFIHTKQTITNY
jgi:hypothetical protein